MTTKRSVTGTTMAVNTNNGTAVKKLLPYENPLKGLAGLGNVQTTSYLGCSGCKCNLEEYARTEELSQDTIRYCPECNRRFVEQVEIKCYACSVKLNSVGTCLNCGAKHDDDDGLKAATIYIRALYDVTGKIARHRGKLEIMGDAEIFNEVKEDAKRQKWVDRVESGENPKNLNSPPSAPVEVLAPPAVVSSPPPPVVIEDDGKFPIVIMYDDKDRPFNEEFLMHMALLRRSSPIRLMDIHSTPAGISRSDDKDAMVKQAKLFILLISGDLVESEILRPHLRKMMERRQTEDVRVIPVLVRPCLFEETPVGTLQPLPRSGKAVSEHKDHDGVWVEIVKGVREYLESKQVIQATRRSSW